jgi:hypothetical protein
MRHAFSFPPHIREAVRLHVRKAVEGIAPGGFAQEPAYVAALLGRLNGTAYEGADGSVIFTTTNVNSIGPGAAERWSGADLAIVAAVAKGNVQIKKAILAQAKLGTLRELPSREGDRLVGQIKDMRRLTRSPKVILIGETNGHREPVVASGTRIAEGLPTKMVPLPDYFVRRVLTTFDGDTRSQFVVGVQDSTLRQLRVAVRVLEG